jgi:CheY-like chemotaxis protein
VARVIFPAEPLPREAQSRKGLIMPSSTPAPAIVLVDDEAYVRAILQRILADIADDYELLVVESGAEALELLATRPVPLLLTDYRMPRMSGLDLAQAVKASSPTTRIVLITADASADVAERAALVGIDHVLVKPFVLEELRRIVRAALD